MVVSLQEVARYMRMGASVPDGALAARMEKMLAEVQARLRPVRVWRRVALGDFQDLHGLKILAGCRDAYLVCGTLGAGVDALLRRVAAMSGADALIVQAAGTALIERYMDAVEDEIRAELAPGESLRMRFSPGYGDLPLAAQRMFFNELDASRKIGVSLTDTLLMVPSKSVSAVIGVEPAKGINA